MFDTRSGFWLMMSILISGSGDDLGDRLRARQRASPTASFGTRDRCSRLRILLPVIAILSVTSEWSQRTGLITFTLVPHRGQVILAKAIAAVLVGVVSMIFSFAIGAVGNVVGAAINGVDTRWNIEPGRHVPDRPRQHPGTADRLHARCPDPQLRRCDRRLLRLLVRDPDRSWASSRRSARTGSRSCSRGSTSTSRQTPLFDGESDRGAVGTARRRRASRGSSSRWHLGVWAVLRSEVK